MNVKEPISGVVAPIGKIHFHPTDRMIVKIMIGTRDI
jgi:hypothetical protein